MHRFALTLLFAAGEALAHPDHGPGGWLSANLLHLLTEPDHLAMILFPAVVGAGWLLRRLMRERSSRRGRSAVPGRRNRA